MNVNVRIETLGDALRRLAGPDDSSPDGILAEGVTASISCCYQRESATKDAAWRMKHFYRLRSALLALAKQEDRNEALFNTTGATQ